MLERLFGLRAAGTDVRSKLLAGATTSLGMAYSVFDNPSILAEAGIDSRAAFVATLSPSLMPWYPRPQSTSRIEPLVPKSGSRPLRTSEMPRLKAKMPRF